MTHATQQSQSNEDRKNSGFSPFICKLPPTGSDLEIVVLSWFASRHEVMWIPIHVIKNGPNGVADAQAEERRVGGSRIVREIRDLHHLPVGIMGWLFPAHQDDTDVVCKRPTQGEITFGNLFERQTGKQISFQSSR